MTIDMSKIKPRDEVHGPVIGWKRGLKTQSEIGGHRTAFQQTMAVSGLPKRF